VHYEKQERNVMDGGHDFNIFFPPYKSVLLTILSRRLQTEKLPVNGLSAASEIRSRHPEDMNALPHPRCGGPAKLF